MFADTHATMPALAISLVFLSAGLHASWNLLLKTGEDKLVFAWLTVATGPIILWPVLCIVGVPPSTSWPFLLASAVVHVAYWVTLARAYEDGHLSVVYPVARGIAPIFVTFGAMLMLHEKLTLFAICAIVLIGSGVVAIGLSDPFDHAPSLQ